MKLNPNLKWYERLYWTAALYLAIWYSDLSKLYNDRVRRPLRLRAARKKYPHITDLAKRVK